MRYLVCLLSWCVVLLLFNEGQSLRCRSGNQQADTQYQKVLQICRKRYAGRRTDNGGSMSDSDSSENYSNSEEQDVFDRKFFYRKNDRYSNNQSSSNQNNSNRNRQNSSRTGNDNNRYQFNNTSNGNWRDSQGRSRQNNDRDSWSSRGSNNRNYGFNNGDNNNNNNNNGRENACVIQCFFNELNVVDQRGFPERDSVIHLMSQNIQDPELRDFVQESITECFRYLDSATRKEKCDFSQNLLTCLAEKGQEKCEDWEN